MTSSDGFYSPPCWQTPDTSTVPSSSASSSAPASSREDETGQSQIGAPLVDKRSSWVQVSAETCSDEQPVIYRPVTPPPHAYLQLTETARQQTQNCQTGPPLDAPGSPSFSQKHNLSPESTINIPVDFQDGLTPEGVPRTHEANKTFTLYPVQAEGLRWPCLASGQLTNASETLTGHGGVGEQSESVLFLLEGGTDGEPSQHMTDKDSNDSVEKHCQDPLFSSAGAEQNVCLQLTETVAWHTLDLHAASAVDVPGSQSPERNSGLLSSDVPNASVQAQKWLDSDRPPRTHSEDETFKSDPVITAGLSPQPRLGSRNLTDASDALAAHGGVGDHGETVSWLSEMGSDGQVVQPVTDEVTTVQSFKENGQDPQSASAAECPSKVTVGSACPSKVTVGSACSERADAVVCPAQAVDTHTASALGVCGSPSPSPQHNSVPVCSEGTLVELHNAISSERAPITHTADVSSGLDPGMAGDHRGASETLAGVGCARFHGECAVLVSDAGMEAGEVAKPLPDEVTAADSVEEKCSQDCPCTSADADAVQDVCQKETVGTLSPSPLEEGSEQQPAPSRAAGSNAACPDAESPHTDSPVAAGATDACAKEKQTQTGCCDTQLQNSHQHSQPSTDPWEPAGQPYSLRRRRRGAPTCSSAPVSAKRSCPGLEQACSSSSSSTSTSAEGCSQDVPSPLTVPVKRKRGRPRKTPQAVDLSEVSSVTPVHAEKVDSQSAVCESTVPEDCLDETPDTSLSTRLHLKRKLAAAASGEAEGQENTDLPLDPPFTPRTDAQQSQDLELPVAPCSDLTLEQILQDDPMPLTPLSLPEDGEEEEEDPEEEEEELPSILERKPMSITEGLCVWCKFRKYPFWPAVVKSVNHKNKKASIVFIDTFLIDEKGIRKGLTVSLKTLKPLDCEDAEELTEQARLQYGEAITWCLELIYDYRIRIGCGSFSGSFIEYFASEISCPLRQKYSQGTSDLTFPTQLIVDDLCESSEEDGVGEQADGHQCKKVLPDRARAARTRANEKLVDFIVRKRGAERRLLAVISGQEASKWLRALQKGSRFVVDPYLEDEEQVDQVYRYLDEFFRKTPQALPCLAHLERIPFVLDVLLPEALICAIAGVDDISLEQAEEKYRKGPCISKRERQEFNVRIEELMKTLNQCKQVL